MRLIDTETEEFIEIVDLSKIPLYAILSHTWERAPKREKSYQDVVNIQERYRISSPSDCEVSSDPLPNGSGPVQDISTSRVTSPTRRSIWDPDSGLSEKIRRACEIARRDGYRYIWIDSSCIDKASSSELSEAINSMFNWYGNAQVCYAFLSDVPPNEDVRADGSKFRGSRWFTRAWTLQELIAPRVVVFLSQDWEVLGTKGTSTDLIQEITHIDRGILTHEKALADESVAERMRWASRREATRVEDEAYSLLGIFGITMPTLYGEGQYAFRRLQEGILQRIPDQSLLAWGSVCLPISQEPGQIKISPCASQTPFAPSPRSFDLSHGHIVCASGPRFESLKLPLEEYTPTPYGIRTQLCFLPLHALNPELTVIGLDGVDTWYLAILGSQHTDDRERLLCRLCYVTRPKSDVEFLHIPDEILAPGSHYLDTVIFTVSLDDLERTINTLSDRLPPQRGSILARLPSRAASTQLQTRTIYLPHPKPSTTEWRLDKEHTVLKLTLSTWARAALRAHGYTVLGIHPIERPPDYHSLTLFNGLSGIHIQYRHILIHPPSSGWRYPVESYAMVIEARIWIFSPDSEYVPERTAIQTTGPPYTSAVWADERPWAMTLPPRSVHLLTHSGDEATSLRFGLGLTAPSHYHTRVEVGVATDVARASTSAWSTRDVTEGLPRVMLDSPHTGLKLTMLGSVRRALETHGYSVHVDGPGPNLGSSHSHSCSLTISNANPRFTVTVKYFHTLRETRYLPLDGQELVVAARVSLESSSVPGNGSETYQDGPYVVSWTDWTGRTHPWRWTQEQRRVNLTTPTGDSLTLRLGLDLAWRSEYYLLVDIEHGGLSSGFRGEPDARRYEVPYLLDEPHSSVTLTLPGHIHRALQSQGYDVHFEGSNGDHPDRCRLTLADANLTIHVEYSHRLSTDPDGKQCLTFRACVEALSSRRSSGDDSARLATQREGLVVDWDARHPGLEEGGWHWNLPSKDVRLTLPTGLELFLRLGFYLVWLSEYCLTVEVIPLPRPMSHWHAMVGTYGTEQ